MKHTRIAPLVLGAATLMASGCGSSGSQSSAPGQVIVKANPICLHATEALAGLYKVSNFKDIPPAAAKTASEFRNASTELANLKPPASMTSDWKVIVDGYQTMATDIAELGEHAKVTTKPDVPVLAQLINAQHAIAVVASKRGIKDCATLS
ncbi:MAG TPA: hypothetical protein VK730_04635 [Solirubrobacteraceae bacterium]|jgi:hypothetical protein|nr:hypothetical protein [Solirubrobacteraceae bacterium]